MNIPVIGRGTQLSLLAHDGRTRAVHASEEYDVYAGRGRRDGGAASARYGRHMLEAVRWFDLFGREDGWLGNPHPVGRACEVCSGRRSGDPEVWHAGDDALRLFERDFLRCLGEHPAFRRAVLALRGKRLGCPGCATGAPCHARIIAAWVEQQPA